MDNNIPKFPASNNQFHVKALFLLNQNPPKTHRTSRSSHFDSRHLAGVHHCQAVHAKTQNWVGQRCVAWWHVACRQADPRRNPENHIKTYESPGGSSSLARRFMENSRNTKFNQGQREIIHIFKIYIMLLIKDVKLASSSSHNLDYLLKLII